MGPSDEDVLGWFDPVQTHGVDTVKVEMLREAHKATARRIMELIPSSAHRTVALRDLHRASQSAIFALTHQEEQA